MSYKIVENFMARDTAQPRSPSCFFLSHS